MPSIDEVGLILPNAEYRTYGRQPQSTLNTSGRNPAYVQDPNWSEQRRVAAQASGALSEIQSVGSQSQLGDPSISGMRKLSTSVQHLTMVYAFDVFCNRKVKSRVTCWCSPS